MRGDLDLDDRLERIESKIDLMLLDLHSKALDINSLKVKVAVFSSIFGTLAGVITTWLSR